MKTRTKYDRVPLWSTVKWTENYVRKTGYERTDAHKRLLEQLGECMAKGGVVMYTEIGAFPHTYATAVMVHGTKDRQSEVRATGKRTDAVVNDIVGTERLRQDNFRGHGTGEEVVVDVGRQRKRKPRPSK